MNSSSPIIRKLLNIAKLIVVLAVLVFIVYKLEYAYHIQQLYANMPQWWNDSSLSIIAGVLLLMPLNWWLEMLKWQLIISKHEKVTFLQSLKSITTGISLGIITPNQLGDIAGKSLFLQHYSKLQGAAASLCGNLAQTIVMLAVGCVAIAIWLGQQYLPNLQIVLFIASIFACITTLVLFLNINLLPKLITHPKVAPYVNALADYSTWQLSGLLILSALRLAVFSYQFYLLLELFGIHLPVETACINIILIFAAQTLLPSFILLEIGVRGAVALFFLGMVTDNQAGILGASYGLWIVNMMLPALLGLYFLATLKWRS